MDCGMQGTPDGERNNLDFGNLSQYLLCGKQADATRIQNPQCHHMGKNESTAQYLVPVLYLQHRVHHLGKKVPEEAALLQLWPDETAEREQTDDGCMEAASHRKMGEIAGQASYAETARPAGTHHPGFNPARSMDPRPVLGKRNYRHRCLADRQALSGHRKGKGISGPEHQEKG